MTGPTEKLPVTGMLNAMTVDVEEHFQVSAFEGIVPREEWDRQPSRVEENTNRLLELFDEAGVKATFFVLGWIAERRPALVREIARRGHEIGCHGYSHQLVYRQTPDEFRSEIVRARKLLQDLTGQSVAGHRAASFSVGRGNLWALDVIAEAGFTYDSSLFPVRHDRYGIPKAPRSLYRLTTPNGALAEAPPSTVLIGGATLPVAGGGYLRLFPTALTHWAVRRLNGRERMPAVIYLHPWELDPKQPRPSGISLFTRFRHYNNLSRTAGRLTGLLARFRFGPLQQVIREAGELPLAELTLCHEAS